MKNLLLLTLLLSASAAFAQSNSVYNATTYAYTTQVTSGNSATGSSSMGAQPTAFAQGIPFSPYNTNASVTINRNGANAETVTPTTVANCFPNSVTCTLSASFASKHTRGENIQSGTFGLQEAINVATAAGAGTVSIDATWQGPSGTSLILAAKGNANVQIQDNRSPSGSIYQWNGSAYVASGGGSATLPAATAAGQDLRATGAGTTYTAQNATNQKELSCSSDIGAQFNAAVTTLGGNGRIIMPNCLTATMSTTASFGQGISIGGYGKLGSKIQCTVAGKCFAYTGNPTTQGEIGGEISDFEIDGNGASGQILMENSGMSGYTIHDVQFEPYAGSGDAATCLEFSNDTSGQFTEGNRTFNVSLERQCTTGVLFFQNVADTSTSFGYNFFEFHVVSQGANYAVTATASAAGTQTAFLYNGSLTIYGNHVGPGGGILQFLNGFSTDSALGVPNERIYIVAEENGSGAGVEVNIPGTGSTLRFYGNIVNGAFNASGSVLATTLFDPNLSLTLATDVPYVFFTQAYTMPGALTVAGLLNLTTGTINLNAAGGNWQQLASTSAQLLSYQDLSTTNYPFLIFGQTGIISNGIGTSVPSNGGFQWSSLVTGVAAIDTGLWRPAANVISSGTFASQTGGAFEADHFLVAGAQTTVSCATSGTAKFSEPEQGPSDKKVIIYLSACVGAASYTYPTAFTNTPSVYQSNNVATAIVSSVSATATTVTGTTTTGSIILEGF